MDYTIGVPTYLSSKKISDFFDELRRFKKEVGKYDRLIFDFSKCKYITPAGALVVSSFSDLLREQNSDLEIIIRYKPKNRLTKFLQIFGLLNVEELYEDEYVKKLTDYTVKLRRCGTYDECLTVQQEIMRQVKDRTDSTESAFAAIDYMITEIWDNAGTHGYKCYYSDSYPKPVYLTAFSYRTGVEVAILDLGQGIHESLRKKDKYSGLGAKEALKIAIQDEVTGHPNNSPGFGLFSAVELTKSNNGEIAIWSSGRSIEIDENGYSLGRGNFYDGTLVNFKINANVELPFNDIISSTSVDNYLEEHQIV